MNIIIYKNGIFLYEAEYVEDTIDGMIVNLNGKRKRLIIDKDYSFSHEVSDKHFAVLYINSENHINSFLIRTTLKKEFEKKFTDIPTYFELQNWLKTVDEQVKKV